MEQDKRNDFRIITIGASAGGVEPLLEIARTLHAELPCAVFIVVHTPARPNQILPELLDRAGPLASAQARDGEPVRPGRIYVAPPDYHLLLDNAHVTLNHGPRENGFRPAVDPLFRSAAAYGPRVVGIILSGGLNDGTAGLLAIKQAGGVTVVQDPLDAQNYSMPGSALRHVDPQFVLPAAEIGPLINRLAREPARRALTPAAQENSGDLPQAHSSNPLRPRQGKAHAPAGDRERRAAPKRASDLHTPAGERSTAPARRGNPHGQEPHGEPAAPGSVPAGTATTFTCPDCGGTLWETRLGDFSRYECRSGHAFTDLTLSAAQTERLETALWTAVRVLEESSAYLRRLAEGARDRDLGAVAQSCETRALDAEHRAAVILDVLARPLPELEPGEPAPATPPAPRGRKPPGTGDNESPPTPPKRPQKRKSARRTR